mgnify:CR=1 FL=1
MPSTCAFVDCGENDIVTDFDIIVLQFRTKDVDKKDMLTTSVKYTIISSLNFIKKMKSDRKCFNPWNIHSKNIVKSSNGDPDLRSKIHANLERSGSGFGSAKKSVQDMEGSGSL